MEIFGDRLIIIGRERKRESYLRNRSSKNCVSYEYFIIDSNY